MNQSNVRLARICIQTIDREMDLQAKYGSLILKRYGVAENIQKVNDGHRFQVHSFEKAWGRNLNANNTHY
ncbi:hypothetical protein JOD01_003878 [Brevibacillus fulvus]|uniref:Uncharacterized protein n=1 Tax=Brevibacillus fulvus TaxID=1125967 RepID=A0A939BWW5_9BACL|nr:hypothetical protein [Brevibacillus fulvus]